MLNNFNNDAGISVILTYIKCPARYINFELLQEYQRQYNFKMAVHYFKDDFISLLLVCTADNFEQAGFGWYLYKKHLIKLARLEKLYKKEAVCCIKN